MIPILYKEDVTDFSNFGIGVLVDTISCLVTEERNGVYELTLKYPLNGPLYNEIKKERIIKAKPNDISDPQAFRIYRITIPINGIITIYAQHISYDLINIGVIPFSLTSVEPKVAIDTLLEKTVIPHNFTFRTDYATKKNFEVKKPQSVRACLGGTYGSLVNKWGGEFEWDNFTIIHHKGRGSNKGVVIEYGKNLTKLDHDSDISEIYTDILPFAVISKGDGTEDVITLSEEILPITTTLTNRKTLIKDMTDSFDEDEKITESTLREKTQKYIKNNPLGVENPTITISFEPLWKQPEYSALLERVSLCDTVTVKHTQIGVSVKTKVIKTTYDALLEKYTSITLGSARSNFIDQVQNIESEIEDAKTEVGRFPSLLNYAINNATKLITGNSGGYVVLHSAAKDGKPYELLIMDKPDLNDAVKVWRWNVSGLGYSKNGYNGPYETAITADGQIVADFITSGSLVANIIKAGIISSVDGSSYWNIDTGEVVLKAYVTTDQFENKVEEIEEKESKIESNINGITSTVSAITKRVTDTEGNITTLQSNVSTLTQTTNKIDLRVSENESNISSLTLTANKLSSRVSSVEGDVAELEQTTSSLSATVATKADSEGGTSSSFGWKLTSSGFYLYSSNKTVMSVTKSGLSVSGTISATSGTIGGFTISSSSLYKSKTSYANSTAGVYIGTDGIGLGAGSFYVTSSGYLYATSGKIGGMSLTASQMYSQNFILGTVYNIDDPTQSFTTLSFGSTSGNTFTATTVLTNDGCYMQSLSSNYISCGIIRVQSIRADASISASTGFYFGYSGGSVQYYAELSWSGQMLYLKIYNSDKELVTLPSAKTFTVHYACIWGSDVTWNATVAAGSNMTSKDTNAFWGISYATFNYSSSNKSQHTYYFIVSGSNAATTITSYGHIVPWSNNTYDLGSVAYKWRNIYGQAGIVNTSDRNEKFEIQPIPKDYEKIFDSLVPVTFKFIENTSDRTHMGLIAQDVKDAVLSIGLTTKEFAGYCEWKNEDETVGCGLRYSEFVAMNINEIQKLKARVKELEEKIQTMEEIKNET